MAIVTLRLPVYLLVCAVVVGAIEQISLHPNSPAEMDPIPNRVKRQAYEVYSGGTKRITIDGQHDSGQWGPWTQLRECSRSCGGGVLIEERRCETGCTGPNIRYVSCNVDDCPEGSRDFRAEQCSANDDKPVPDGKYYKWKPFTKGKNKCELTCQPEGENFYYKFAAKVTDGTECGDTGGKHICVEGICLPLGCDGKLGSAKREDRCLVCGGDDSNCKTIEEMFDERHLDVGYHDIIKFPKGATRIEVVETRASKNNLAIRNASGEYLLNGGFQIRTLPGWLEIAGTVFDYQKRIDNGHSYESLTARGPIDQELTIALVLQVGSKDSAVLARFSIPVEPAEFVYRPGVWSACSVTCGKGVQTRDISCFETASERRVADDSCEMVNASSPTANRSCETTDCSAEWFTGEWEECTHTCGDLGWQYRVVYCHQVFADGRRITVDDSECEAERPEYSQSCNRFSCPEWSLGPWSACSEQCGPAHQYRSVTCRSAKEGEEGKLLPASACDADGAADGGRSCNLGPCDGLNFVDGDWKLCEKCNDTIETRDVSCQDTTGRKYQLEKCVKEDGDTVPPDERSCATPVPCVYQWHSSEWSECSTKCGHGHRTRSINCAIEQLGKIELMDDSHCMVEAKPSLREECTNEESCTGTYYTGPWTECSASCAGGTQTRVAVCLNYDHEPVPEWCDEVEKPNTTQACNEDECPTCDEGEFGCCPDNATFALGMYNSGCSNCSVSEFGCCADNVTYAQGENAKGCPEEDLIDSSEEGSGEGESSSSSEEDKKCEMTNAKNGDKVDLDCKTMTGESDSSEITGLLTGDGNETASNETEKEPHCSKTEFGCCPDWYTNAEGVDNAGCPLFVLGECNGTKHGCCPDEVTLARGPNLEACGEPQCAASLYGCCKDRTTIAFGPHYKGCERSSFPCELKMHGCCPDGETAALGPNGKGCGESCIVSKYGCCPDGVTTVKGANNEGCPCAFGRYGCCPDGKTTAQGPGYYKCPESCTQSEFGCCPDGKTPARGSTNEGCPCQYTRFGCCPDGVTTALSVGKETCDDCRYSKYGCCPGTSLSARGEGSLGCPITTTTTAKPVLATPERIASCSLPNDAGQPCAEYALQWYYNTDQGVCSQFWYGGCDGNENRFPTEHECRGVCIEPPGQGACYLPKVEGPDHCDDLKARYWYDFNTGSCQAFWYRGCNGNRNNFDQYEQCYSFCDGVRPGGVRPQPTTAAPVTTRPSIVVTRPPTTPWRPVEPPTTEEQRYCLESADSGPCKDYEDQWYFDSFSGQCHTFIYGGCGGNYNRYATQEWCHRRCGHLGSNVRAKDPRTCQMSVSRGHCLGNFQYWYFEPALGRCTSFYYSGCGGNDNRFHSRESCEQLCHGARSAAIILPQEGPVSTPEDFCKMNKEKGPCDEYLAKWWFNAEKGTCQRFYYGGCDGNPNRFDTEAECKARCDGTVDTCGLPKVVGPCRASKPRFYFDTVSRQCQSFKYGGCLGNSNNFQTKADCQNRCADGRRPTPLQETSSGEMTKEPVDGRPAFCGLPFETGTCRANFPRYYYDWARQDCRQFTYGGCDGNANRFATLQHCQQTCGERSQNLVLLTMRVQKALKKSGMLEKPIDSSNTAESAVEPASIPPELCALPVEAGSCYDKILRWNFDVVTGRCVSFFYTGCQGNANRFDSHEACQRACGSYRDQDVCTFNFDAGHCQHFVNKWYYNRVADTCESFIYSGCGGNGNRFSSKEECLNLCREEAKEIVDICTLPRADGECGQQERRYWYSAHTQTCQQFVYSGCDGNENNFATLSKCERLCGVGKRVEDVCLAPLAHGPCGDLTTQYYYHQPSGLCKPFTWGGCRGSPNRFTSKHHCQVRCQGKQAGLLVHNRTEVCRLSFERGPCTNEEQRWFYDVNDGVCKVFVYSGCEGNANRFLTKRRCLTACAGIAAIQPATTTTTTTERPHRFRPHPSRPTVGAPMTCRDDTRKANCQLIVKAGLCRRARYNRYCCASCKNSVADRN